MLRKVSPLGLDSKCAALRSGHRLQEYTGNEKLSKLKSGLYVIGVPIGNFDDITVRALRMLLMVDIVACEDTRVTAKLLRAHGIQAQLVAYHEHNAASVRPVLLEQLASGQAIALVADAGMPLVSDPGYKLVRAAVAGKHAVTCLPGASAPLAALVLSGLPTNRFLFSGFPPPRSEARQTLFRTLARVPATLIFFESAQRLPRCLTDLALVLGNRPACVARELTKFFEEVRRGELAELAEYYQLAGPPKGEIVVVVGPPNEVENDTGVVEKMLQSALAHQSMRDAVAKVAATSSWPRRKVYQLALRLTADSALDK
jgi:16S rRNA (cytidine1402-2'-O)-methyltransferase